MISRRAAPACVMTYTSFFGIRLTYIHSKYTLQRVHVWGAMAGRGQILLVEDQSNTDRLYPLLLALDDYQVTTAKTLAVAAALCSATSFDLLICDAWLPDGDGYSLLASVRRSCSSIRSILVTRTALSWGTEGAITSGFSVCLVKPVTCERLRSAIERVLSGPEGPLLAFSG